MRLFLISLLCLLLAATLASCGAPAQPPEVTNIPEPAATIAPTVGSLLVPEEIQPALAGILETLGGNPSDYLIKSVEEVEWPDACLGISKGGVACAQVITPGYRILLDSPQGEVEIRMDRSGGNFKVIGLPQPTTQSGAGRNGWLEGLALMGPMCGGPVQVGQECPDQPYQASFSVISPNQEVVAQIRADAQGRFRIFLPPGVYTLHPESEGKYPSAADQLVEIIDGETISTTVYFDTGMR